jgi:hypothetical protein
MQVALSPKQKEDLIVHYLSYPEGRDKLAQSTYRPAEQYLKGDPVPGDIADHLIETMGRILGSLDGQETFDQVRFRSLYADLRAMRDRQKKSS